MTLKQIQSDMIAAMKSGDKARKNVLSNLAAAIKKAAIDKKIRDNIPESLVDEVLTKEKKVCQEMIETCPCERLDLMREYFINMAIITEYAPKILSDEKEISELIDEIIFSNPAIDMKTIMPMLKGKVDMKIANKLVKGKLGNA